MNEKLLSKLQHLAERLKQELGTSPEVATVLAYEQARQQSGVAEEPPPPQGLTLVSVSYPGDGEGKRGKIAHPRRARS